MRGKLVLLELVAELFGAEADGAGGIESEVSVEIGAESGIVFLLEMDVGEQAIDDGNVGGELAGLFGRGESVGEAILLEERATEFVVTKPEIGI
jgi:hypothetical protein